MAMSEPCCPAVELLSSSDVQEDMNPSCRHLLWHASYNEAELTCGMTAAMPSTNWLGRRVSSLTAPVADSDIFTLRKRARRSAVVASSLLPLGSAQWRHHPSQRVDATPSVEVSLDTFHGPELINGTASLRQALIVLVSIS